MRWWTWVGQLDDQGRTIQTRRGATKARPSQSPSRHSNGVWVAMYNIKCNEGMESRMKYSKNNISGPALIEVNERRIKEMNSRMEYSKTIYLAGPVLVK